MKKRKKSRSNNDPFASLSNASVGLGSMAVTTGISAAMAGGMVAHYPAMGPVMAPAIGSFGTIAGAAPIATLAVVGKASLDALKPYQKKKKGQYY